MTDERKEATQALHKMQIQVALLMGDGVASAISPDTRHLKPVSDPLERNRR